MEAILISIVTFFSTIFGGLFALKNSNKLKYILAFTAGVLIGVVAFDVLPEIYKNVKQYDMNFIKPMIALVFGYLLFHIAEKTILIHNDQEKYYSKHKHPKVGVLSALALSGHSFLDGVGIGIGFQISPVVGIAVSIAVIGHDFADGLNTVTLMLNQGNKKKKAFQLLLLDAVAPVIGVLSTFLFHLSPENLVLYLGFFAGFLLYIGSSEILPEAHSEGPSSSLILLTVTGTIFIFIVTRFAV